MAYLFSGYWPYNHGQQGFISWSGLSVKSDSFCYRNECFTTIALVYLIGRSLLQVNWFVAGLTFYFNCLTVNRVSSSTKYVIVQWWMFYVGNNLTSTCSMSSVKCHLQQCLLDISLWRATWVFGTQHEFFGRIPLLPLWPATQLNIFKFQFRIFHIWRRNGQLGLCCPIICWFSLDHFINAYILGSFYFINFLFYPQWLIILTSLEVFFSWSPNSSHPHFILPFQISLNSTHINSWRRGLCHVSTKVRFHSICSDRQQQLF